MIRMYGPDRCWTFFDVDTFESFLIMMFFFPPQFSHFSPRFSNISQTPSSISQTPSNISHKISNNPGTCLQYERFSTPPYTAPPGPVARSARPRAPSARPVPALPARSPSGSGRPAGRTPPKKGTKNPKGAKTPKVAKSRKALQLCPSIQCCTRFLRPVG
jgi:hypothetical protein